MGKKALALSGGGPAVGIEIGALKVFEEKGIDFHIFSCACVGSWVGCLYNSLPPAATTDKINYYMSEGMAINPF